MRGKHERVALTLELMILVIGSIVFKEDAPRSAAGKRMRLSFRRFAKPVCFPYERTDLPSTYHNMKIKRNSTEDRKSKSGQLYQRTQHPIFHPSTVIQEFAAMDQPASPTPGRRRVAVACDLCRRRKM